MYVFILIFVIVFIIWLFFLFDVRKVKRYKKISNSQATHLIEQYKRIPLSADNAKEQIIDYDKLYHKALRDLWYMGNFWDILKLKPLEIDNINNVWTLHKLRNKLVHDFDLLEETMLREKAEDYKIEIKRLLKTIT